MVRRWSYVNQLNSVSFSNYSSLDFAHYDATFRANIHFKRDIHSISKLSRKSWSRRRHLNNWLIYQNLLSNWSNEYLFFKQYSKFTFNYQLFKNSFFSHNLMILRKSSNSQLKGMESFISSPFISRISNYFNRLNFSTYLFFKRLKNNSWVFLTTPGTTSTPKLLESFNLNPFYTTHQLNLYPIDSKLLDLDCANQIVSLLFNVSLLKSVELYKTLTLLTLINVK